MFSGDRHKAFHVFSAFFFDDIHRVVVRDDTDEEP